MGSFARLGPLSKTIMPCSFAFAGLFSCAAPDFSRLKGHFESSDATQLEAYRGQQQVIAEHEPSQGVIMALTMFTEHQREDMAQAFLQAAIDTLWVVVPFDYTRAEEQADLGPLYDRVGADQSRIELLRQPRRGQLREWARDYGPLTARSQDGRLVLLDFNYYMERPADDSVPTELARRMQLPRLSLPIYNEGGNFMSNSRGDCLMSERVLFANDAKERSDDLILDRASISAYYKDYAGCKTVHIFPVMPYEGTRHIDLWGKFLADDTVLIGAIPEAVLALPAYSEEDRGRVLAVKDYLDARALDISRLGFRVQRLPMPAPIFAADGFRLFRSYTNSLLLNGTAFIPRYQRPSNESDGVNGQYIDADLIPSYEREVAQVYRSLGYAVQWIESDSLIAKGGAVHCTAMQLAR